MTRLIVVDGHGLLEDSHGLEDAIGTNGPIRATPAGDLAGCETRLCCEPVADRRTVHADRPDAGWGAPWFRRFGPAGGWGKRIGIVALARKLAIAPERYVEHGVMPDGATLKVQPQASRMRRARRACLLALYTEVTSDRETSPDSAGVGVDHEAPSVLSFAAMAVAFSSGSEKGGRLSYVATAARPSAGG